MPYLALDLEAMDRAPNVGRAAGMSEDSIIAGLTRMWRHCWQEKTDQVDHTAVRGFFGGEVHDALVSFRFLEPNPDGFRVRGAGRYLRISKAQSEAGKKASGNLKRGSKKAEQEPESAPGLAPGGAGEEPEGEPERSRRCSPALHRALSIEHLEVVKPPPGPPPAKTVEDSMEFANWWNVQRGHGGLLPETVDERKLVEWYASAVEEAGEAGIVEAVTAYLTDEDFKPRGWPLKVFMSPNVWRSRVGSGPKPRGRVDPNGGIMGARPSYEAAQ